MAGTGQEHADAGRVWLVTGASRGLGLAVCEAALEAGDAVVATARRPEAIEGLRGRHRQATATLPLDVVDPGDARKAVEESVATFGRVDVVVNNAGYGHFGAIEELTDAELREQFDVNLFGVLNVTRAALPQMRRQRSGHLVQMSSLNGVVGMMGGGYYVGSKFAVEGISESLAQEVEHLGIKVTIVEPGPHRTEFAGSRSARIAAPIDDYADSVGKARELFAQLDGNQPGDPQRAARAIVHAVTSPKPPLRLPLGRMAIEEIRNKLDRQREELDAWQDVARSTDFAD
jgi:NAD(P)-dependent dehydrogenase (short-subunit alcohol dehydrogenase family)